MTPPKAVALLYVSDIRHSVRWYQSLLGFELAELLLSRSPEMPTLAILKNLSTVLMLCHRGSTSAKTSVHYDLRVHVVRGISELHARLMQCGVVSRNLEHTEPGDCEFDVRDPDGNIICLSQSHTAIDMVPPANTAYADFSSDTYANMCVRLF